MTCDTTTITNITTASTTATITAPFDRCRLPLIHCHPIFKKITLNYFASLLLWDETSILSERQFEMMMMRRRSKICFALNSSRVLPSSAINALL